MQFDSPLVSPIYSRTQAILFSPHNPPKAVNQTKQSTLLLPLCFKATHVLKALFVGKRAAVPFIPLPLQCWAELDIAYLRGNPALTASVSLLPLLCQEFLRFLMTCCAFCWQPMDRRCSHRGHLAYWSFCSRRDSCQ